MPMNENVVGSVVAEALASDPPKVVQLAYVDSKGATSTRLIEPTEVKDGTLWGWCRTRNALRQFKCDQILALNIGTATFTRRDVHKDDSQDPNTDACGTR